VPEALAKLNLLFFQYDGSLEASVDRFAEALNIDSAWIRNHTETGEQARRWVSAARPGGWAPALARARAGGALDRRGTEKRAAANQGDSRLHHREPAVGHQAPQLAHRQPRRLAHLGTGTRRSCLRATRPRPAQLRAGSASQQEPGVRHRARTARRAGA
jgi:hypothetical protein